MPNEELRLPPMALAVIRQPSAEEGRRRSRSQPTHLDRHHEYIMSVMEEELVRLRPELAVHSARRKKLSEELNQARRAEAHERELVKASRMSRKERTALLMQRFRAAVNSVMMRP
ncbi:unnamed protein product, partial [Polarella glacialis]